MIQILKAWPLIDDGCESAVVCEMYLEDAHPVFGVRSDVRGQGVATLQGCLGQETLPHILEDDMGKVGCFHNADAAAR